MTFDPFSPPPGINPLKFYPLLWKRYFDTGLSVLSYAKYVAGVFGGQAVLNNDVAKATVIVVGYGLFCFFVGWAWHRYRMIQVENEISNRFNPFVTDMREMRETHYNNKKPVTIIKETPNYFETEI